MIRWARQARNIARYSCTRFCFFLACKRLSGLMFSSPIKTRLQPARAAFSTKFGMRWQRVSTWMMNCNSSPSRSRISISRSKIASQLRLRAKLSSVMKKRKTPCARLARTRRVRSSASCRRGRPARGRGGRRRHDLVGPIEGRCMRSVVREAGAMQTDIPRLFEKRPERRVGQPRKLRSPMRDRIDPRVESERLGQRRPRFVEVALEAECGSQPKMRKPEPRICGSRLSEDIDRLIDTAEDEVANAQPPIVDPNIRVMRAEAQRLLDVWDRRLGLAHEHQRSPEVVLRIRVVRVERNRLFGFDPPFGKAILRSPHYGHRIMSL